ncbi:transmembrane protein 119b [Pristis pectinata]|uniref:transmembrane protein 119b n=1 Tax=Pristis pectinata TaxID=685728 RepID=UPI00223DB461|nr:transmembrane protein 119b [Pristis pectinata]
MAIWLMLLQFVLTSMCPCTARYLPNSTDVVSLSSAEASGSYETEGTSTDVALRTSEISDVDTTSVAYTSSPAVTSAKPGLLGTIIMEFISQYAVFIIIAAVALVLLLIIVCTVIFMKLSKASAYYPSSYPTKKYVDEQDKRGSSKNFEEVTGMVSDEPKEDTINSTEQLQANILSATHNLKKATPSKGEEKQEVGTSGKGEPDQAVGKEGRNSTEPGTNEEGPMSDTVENNTAKAPEGDWKEEGKEIPEQEDKGGVEGPGKGNRGNEEEEGKDKKELETGAVPGTNSKQPSASDMGSKSPQTADQPQVDADADQSMASDKVDGAEGQEPKEVKFAQQGLSESSTVAEPCTDHSKDLEETPLISKPNGAPSDIRAF